MRAWVFGESELLDALGAADDLTKMLVWRVLAEEQLRNGPIWTFSATQLRRVLMALPEHDRAATDAWFTAPENLRLRVSELESDNAGA